MAPVRAQYMPLGLQPKAGCILTQLLQVCTDFITAVNSAIQALLWSNPFMAATAGVRSNDVYR